MSGFRLPTGGAIDRGRPLAFTFDGKPYLGCGGRQHRLGASRGRRPHRRPQLQISPAARRLGGLDRGAERDRRRDPRGPHDAEPARDGRAARERPRASARSTPAPTAAEDRAALIDGFRGFMPSGFYYKTFLWPRWETFEPTSAPWPGSDRSIRTIARRPTIRISMRTATCSSSARGRPGSPRRRRPREPGRVVFLLDDRADIGGQLLHRGGLIDGGDWREWAEDVARRGLKPAAGA